MAEDLRRAGSTATYGQLLFGDDASVTEVGDWFANDGCRPDVALGYRSLDGLRNRGIYWAPAGGLVGSLPAIEEVAVFRQNHEGDPYAPSGFQAHSAPVLLERFATWTADVGDTGGAWGPGFGRTYTDVVRILFYHGTRSPEIIAGSTLPNRCSASDFDAASPLGGLYRSFGNYETYAIELYLARGVGIVREALAFTESTYFGLANLCHGAYMGHDELAGRRAWAAYLDD